MPEDKFSVGRARSWGAFLVLTLVWAPGLGAQNADLIGRWESVSRSKGGIGTVLVLHSDNTAAVSPAAMVDFDYRVEGTRLTLTFTDPYSGETSQSVIQAHVTTDSMVQSVLPSGEQIRFWRVDSAVSDSTSILGAWSFTHPSTDARAYQVFATDGKMHLRVPFRTDRGTYSVTGDTVTIIIDGAEALRTPYRIDGDQLTLASTDRWPERYVRVRWFAREPRSR